MIEESDLKGNYKKSEKLEKQKLKLLNEIDDLKKEYNMNRILMNRNNQVTQAFVLFRSMEGCERAKVAFSSWKITRFWFTIFPCCMS